MDKYAEYLDDTDDASAESTSMMREAMAHTQVFCPVVPFLFVLRMVPFFESFLPPSNVVKNASFF